MKRATLCGICLYALGFLILSCSEKKGKYFEHTSYSLSSKIKIDYTSSKFDGEGNFYVDEKKEIKIDPNETALVLIDIWRLKYLDSVVVNYINPLIEEMSGLGVKIIYAPSGGQQNRNLNQTDEGVYFYNFEMMDRYLKDNNINNLFYMGFDAFYCVLDKPNGIFSYQSRNGNDAKIFLIDDGTMSFTKENKKVATELLKKNGVGIFQSANYKQEFKFPKNHSTYKYGEPKKVVPKGNNLVLIFKKDSLSAPLNNFERKLVKNNIEYATVKDDILTYGDKKIPHHGFTRFLEVHKVDNVIYCGYHLNNEILWSEYGMISMYIKKRYNFVNTPNFYFLNDLSYLARSKSSAQEMEKAAITNNTRGFHNMSSKILLEAPQN